MKLLRPYVPLEVRLEVALRQLGMPMSTTSRETYVAVIKRHRRLRIRLSQALASLKDYLGADRLHLDHDPALVNRKFNKRTGKYTPDANDPKYLVYRSKAGHDIKTRVRGDGAQLSDLALRRKEKRIARSRDPMLRRHKWPPSRPIQNRRPS